MSEVFEGCLPDELDDRDYKYSDICGASTPANVVYDFRPFMPPIYNQQNIGSCTAQATIRSLVYQIRRRKGEVYCGSRLFSYYMTRLLRGRTDLDSGATLREACESVRKYGTCNDVAYPETDAYRKPTFGNLVSSMRYKANAYYRVQGFSEILDALSRDIPVIFSTDFYRWGNVGKDGIVRNALTWVNSNSKSGHAMLIAGYNPYFIIDGKQVPIFIVANSHDTYSGDMGYFYVPAQQLVGYNMGDSWVVFLDTVPTDLPEDSMPHQTVVTVAPDPNTIFSIIIDFCTAPEPAIAMRDFYNKNGYPCMIRQFQSSMGIRWVVMFESIFDTVEKAQVKSNELRSHNFRNFIGVI